MNHHFSTTIVFLLLFFSMSVVVPKNDSSNPIIIWFTFFTLCFDLLLIMSPFGLFCKCNTGLTCKCNTSDVVCVYKYQLSRYFLLYVAVSNVVVAGDTAMWMLPWHAAYALVLIVIFSTLLLMSAMAK